MKPDESLEQAARQVLADTPAMPLCAAVTRPVQDP